MFWYAVGGLFVYWFLVIGLSIILDVSTWMAFFILTVGSLAATLWRNK